MLRSAKNILDRKVPRKSASDANASMRNSTFSINSTHYKTTLFG